jgi:hypothetical protein
MENWKKNVWNGKRKIKKMKIIFVALIADPRKNRADLV